VRFPRLTAEAHTATYAGPRGPRGLERAAALWASDRARLFAGACAAGVLSVVLAAYVLHLGRAHLSLPWSYAGAGDTKFYLLIIKGIISHGSYQNNPSLGAPFGLQLYDFPQGADNLNLLVIRTLGLFSANPALVLNLFFLLTFPLTALCAYFVLRTLGASSGAAVVCAVIFSLLPYHFYRGESQVLLSAYYSVPLAALLFLWLWGERGLFARRLGSGRLGLASWASRRSLLTLLACLVIGSAGLYYAVFALTLLLGGSIVALCARRGRAAVLSGLLAASLIAAMLAVNLAPSLRFRAEHGPNRSLARTTMQSDQLGLRLSNLLLPVQQHRLTFLANVNQSYGEATSTGYCEACFENLGAVGSVGFLWLCLLALASIVGVAGAFATRAIYRSAALGVALAFAIATIGGVSGLIAFFLTRDIRGWNRISLLIAFFSLLAVALLLDSAVRWLAGRRAGQVLGVALLTSTLALGALDETSAYFVPRYTKDARQWSSDAKFVQEIQSRLPAGAAVLQLPYVPFPEGYGASSTGVSLPNPTFDTTYELARGYIHSERLRWSYGAMKGRAADWQAELAVKPLYLSLAAASVDGFQGLWVDPHGYAPKLRPRLAPLLSGLLGVAPLYSPRHDLLFFDLRPFGALLARSHSVAALQALRSDTLHPLRTTCGANGLALFNPSPSARTATLSMRLSVSSARPIVTLVHYPDGVVEQLSLSTSPITLHKQLSLPGYAGSAVRFTLRGLPRTPAARAAGPLVAQPTLTEDALLPFEHPPGRAAAAQMPAGTIPPPCQQLLAAVKTTE
jgi:hypothetical protein